MGEIQEQKRKTGVFLILQSITTKVQEIFFSLYKNNVASVAAYPSQSYPSGGHIQIRIIKHPLWQHTKYYGPIDLAFLCWYQILGFLNINVGGDLKFLTFLHSVCQRIHLIVINVINIITVPLWRHFIFCFGFILLMMFGNTLCCQLLLMSNIG